MKTIGMIFNTGKKGWLKVSLLPCRFVFRMDGFVLSLPVSSISKRKCWVQL